MNFLKKRGWLTYFVTTIKEAVEIISTQKPTHIMLSWNTPNANIPKTEKMLSSNFNVPCIVFTEKILDGTNQSAIASSSIKHYILPPISGPSVHMRICKMLKDKADAGRVVKTKTRNSLGKQLLDEKFSVKCHKQDLPKDGEWTHVGQAETGDPIWMLKTKKRSMLKEQKGTYVFKGERPPILNHNGEWSNIPEDSLAFSTMDLNFSASESSGSMLDPTNEASIHGLEDSANSSTEDIEISGALPTSTKSEESKKSQDQTPSSDFENSTTQAVGKKAKSGFFDKLKSLTSEDERETSPTTDSKFEDTSEKESFAKKLWKKATQGKANPTSLEKGEEPNKASAKSNLSKENLDLDPHSTTQANASPGANPLKENEKKRLNKEQVSDSSETSKELAQTQKENWNKKRKEESEEGFDSKRTKERQREKLQEINSTQDTQSEKDRLKSSGKLSDVSHTDSGTSDSKKMRAEKAHSQDSRHKESHEDKKQTNSQDIKNSTRPASSKASALSEDDLIGTKKPSGEMKAESDSEKSSSQKGRPVKSSGANQDPRESLKDLAAKKTEETKKEEKAKAQKENPRKDKPQSQTEKAVDLQHGHLSAVEGTASDQMKFNNKTKLFGKNTESILAQCVVKALEALVSDNTTTSKIEPLRQASYIDAIPIFTNRYQGLLIFGTSGPNRVGAEFSRSMKEYVISLLAQHGETMNDEGELELSIQNFDFVKICGEFAEFLTLSSHKEFELGMAFLESNRVFPQRTTSSEKDKMFSVDAEYIKPDCTLNFDAYIHMPLNGRHIKYVKKGGQLTQKQKENFEKFGLKHFHIQNNEMREFLGFCASSFVEELLKQFTKLAA